MTGPIRVWAPRATSAELVIGAGRRAMERAEGGWFTAPAPAGLRYLVSLDGGEPRPDPRSEHQPDGVHGPSEVVDHDAFAWHDQGWQGLDPRDAVIYELHVGTFTPEGTFDAVVARLDHLLLLGINAVELMPVATFPGRRGWGYDGVNLYAPHPAYGGPAGLKRLVDSFHSAGIAVILDVVYNHLGPDGNYLGEFGPYFTDVYRTPWGQAINFDGPGSDEVRRFFVDNALHWLRNYHVDGLRLDAVQAIIDTSATHFLEQVAGAVGELGRELDRRFTVIAESDLNDPRLVAARERGGYGLDAQWSDDFHHALHAVLTGERAGYYQDFGALADLAKALTQAFVYDGRYSAYRGRRFGRRPDGIPASRFLAYVQDHDQVGNRARGERISALVPPSLCKVAAALVLLAPFTPMLFAGEEWAASTPFLYFTDHSDPELARTVTEGRRREFSAFGWQPEDVPDPQAEGTYGASRLDWDERDAGAHAEVLGWYRELVRLRRSLPRAGDELSGCEEVRFDEAERWLWFAHGALVVAANFGDEAVSVPGITGTILLASGAGAGASAGGLLIPPQSAVVLRR